MQGFMPLQLDSQESLYERNVSFFSLETKAETGVRAQTLTDLQTLKKPQTFPDSSFVTALRTASDAASDMSWYSNDFTNCSTWQAHRAEVFGIERAYLLHKIG